MLAANVVKDIIVLRNQFYLNLHVQTDINVHQQVVSRCYVILVNTRIIKDNLTVKLARQDSIVTQELMAL